VTPEQSQKGHRNTHYDIAKLKIKKKNVKRDDNWIKFSRGQ